MLHLSECPLSLLLCVHFIVHTAFQILVCLQTPYQGYSTLLMRVKLAVLCASKLNAEISRQVRQVITGACRNETLLMQYKHLACLLSVEIGPCMWDTPASHARASITRLPGLAHAAVCICQGQCARGQHADSGSELSGGQLFWSWARHVTFPSCMAAMQACTFPS